MNIDKLPRPINDKVLIQVCDSEDEVSSSGIIIPGSARNEQRVGVVLATGNGGDDRPMSVKVGDKVYYGRYAATNGVDIEMHGKRYIIISESDVYAVV